MFIDYPMQLKHSIVDGPALCLEECKSLFGFLARVWALGAVSCLWLSHLTHCVFSSKSQEIFVPHVHYLLGRLSVR